MVRNSVQCNHFNGKQSPVFKEAAQAWQRQRAGAELSHKGAMIDLFIPMGKDILLKIVDEGFGVGDLHQQCRREQLEIAGQSNLYTERISCIVNT
jgi:hypothetical protein